ncbi:hypothetical protein CVT24_009510 [Panaeolus cyanescens]|uniref:SWIM-type domain-containing protein n=1 Tax=Panaeolus cyanescens TaxID=181874 RepID=A0A409X460_9AGAR|nr:hypothetical protein CVT24_009510 [Panaeolus cyanescens]
MRKLWSKILEQNPAPKFTRRAVASIKNAENSKEWKRHPDELESAKILLEEMKTPGGLTDSLFRVSPVKLSDCYGFTAISFTLPGMIGLYGCKIREILLDSTWKTNGANYEVYALLGEVHGSGCPLGYLLVKSEEGESGGKEEFLVEFLETFRTQWEAQPVATLTDKDWSEINALQRVFPDAKFQLCLWHCLRAVRQRMAISKQRPKHYSEEEATAEFSFIDSKFVPIGQIEELGENRKTYDVLTKAVPRITITQNGVLRTGAPEAPQPEPDPTTKQNQPTQKLTLRLGGQVVKVWDFRRPLMDEEQRLESQEIDPNDINDPPDHDTNPDNDEGELLKKVDQYINEDEEDIEDPPDWMCEAGETRASDPDYVFCPAAHRKSILRLFARHFCQHQIFPQRNGEHWDAQRIRRESVYEMYQFCHARGLTEVWGYMWTNWYSPKMWKLWARSSSEYLPRCRTTMGAENFFKQLKHGSLHDYARPQLDLLVWVLIHTVTPEYQRRIESLGDSHRLGRSKALSPFQLQFKQKWNKLLNAKISEREYTVDLDNFTCSCGQQKYDSVHLCKHIVQRIGAPATPWFFAEIVRRRTKPLYRHPHIQKGSSGEGDELGSITDGDDKHVPFAKGLLTDGAWRDLDTAPALQRSRKPATNRVEPPMPAPESPSRSYVDLTLSSPPPDRTEASSEASPSLVESECVEVDSHRSSSPSYLSPDDEHEVWLFEVIFTGFFD